MPSRRSSVRPFRAGRTLFVAGVTAAAVLVPSVAWAADGDGTTDPSSAVTTVEGTVGGLLGTGQSGTDAGTAGDQTTTSSSSAATPTLPPLDLSQLDALLAQAGISTECSTSVQADIQQLIADIPATAAQLLQEILGQLGGGTGLPVPLTDPASGKQVLMTLVQDGPTAIPKLSATDPTELALVTDLQKLLTDLLTKCVPAPPTLPAAPTTSSAPVTSQAPETTQPVSYLGYAPTGGSGPDGGSGTPALAVLGGGLLLAGGAGATWYGVRSRAARAKG